MKKSVTFILLLLNKLTVIFIFLANIIHIFYYYRYVHICMV